MRNRKGKRNTPIATLIRNYTDKKSGKVSVSREEIQWRFDCLDWKDQKRILSAFLDSGMSDREWAYTKLLDYWDKSFEPKVRELWEQYREYRCSWIVIRYFPLDYITAHAEDFTDERDYYFISLRLAKDKDYQIERPRLSATDYLALLHHTDRSVSADEASDTLYGIIHDCCVNDSAFMRLERVGEGRRAEVITPANFREVRLAIYYLKKLGMDDTVEQFEQWNQTVEDTIYNSPEFRDISQSNLPLSFEYDHWRTVIARLYAFRALDEKYRKSSDPTFEEMRKAYEQSIDCPKKSQEQPSAPVPTSFLDHSDYNGDDTLPF